MKKDKKSTQLEMNISTAQGKLVKDILWSLIQQTNQTKCFICNKEMTRETFSIEHKIPWVDSENPKKLFWDLNNISFSHLSCNIASRRKGKLVHGTEVGYSYHKCRCELCRKAATDYKRKRYTPEKRKEKYLKSGY